MFPCCLKLPETIQTATALRHLLSPAINLSFVLLAPVNLLPGPTPFSTPSLLIHLQYIADAIEAEIKKGASIDKAVQAVVKKTLTENERVIFNGDNYSQAWHQEAERRGLPNFRHTVESLPTLVTKETRELFERHRCVERRRTGEQIQYFA